MDAIVARPPDVPVLVWLGSTHTAQLTFPPGIVNDEWDAFVTCGDERSDLDVAVEDDVLSVTFEPPVTDLFDTCCTWTLVDDAGEVRVTGEFATTTEPGPSTTEATFVCGDSECTIVLAGVAPVTSVNGQTGDVLLTAGDVGADPAGSAQVVADDLTAHEGLTIQGDGVHGGPLSAADVGADPAGAAAAVAGQLDTHEADEEAHGWELLPPTQPGLGPSILAPESATLLTWHDFRQWTPEDLARGTGQDGYATYVSGGQTSVGVSSFRFPANAVSRIKWQWLPPDGWPAFHLRIGWLNPEFVPGGSASVVWRYSHAGSCIPQSLVAALDVIETGPPTPIPAPVGTGWVYQQLATSVPIPTVGCAVGGIIRSMIERVGTDSGDTHNNVADIFIVTVTRANAP